MGRTIVFWLHLTAGAMVGSVVLIMSMTGVLLTYEKQMLAWADRRAASIAPPTPEIRAVSLDVIVRSAAAAVPDRTITMITKRSDPRSPVSVAMSGGISILVNPYTGHVTGEAPTGMRQLFRTTTEWHRYLAGKGERRALGKAVTGGCNLAFLFLVISGGYLWLPRRWAVRAVAAVAIPRWRHATGRARDFNWHNALGFWSAIPLTVVAASATVISYPWASDLAYRVVGDTPPPRPTPPPVATGAAAAASASPVAAGTTPAIAPALLQSLSHRWQQAESHSANWRSIALRLPAQATAPLVFTIDAGSGGQPQKRGTLTVDAAKGTLLQWETFADQSRGRRFRSLLRFAHTGEYWGVTGQTVAGLVSAAACVLVWTGFSLAWRPVRAWRASSHADQSWPKAA